MIGRSARLVWGGVSLLLLVLLVGSFMLSRDTIREAEQEAQRRAETLAASVLFDELTPEMVEEDILGGDYRDLIIAVQAGILSDDRVAQVRLWKPDGDLIFSTAQLDKVTEFVAEDHPQIDKAVEGETNSLITTTASATRAGLEGSDEELFETFVPLRLASETTISGVAQIDQRYSQIRAEGLKVWRPVQIAVAFLLPAAVVLLVLSIRKREEAGAVPAHAVGQAVVVDDRALRDAQERAQAAERAARDAEARMSEMETRLREADGAGTTPSMLSRVEELDLQLRASEAEREQHVAELQRLEARLAERDAEIAGLREGAGAGSDAAAVIAEAERLIAESERAASEASARAAEAEARATELEEKLRDAGTASATVGAAEGAKKLRADLVAAMTERDELAAKVGELESTLEAARATILSRDKELKAAVAAGAVATAAGEEVAAADERIAAAELKAADAQERLVDAQARLEEYEANRTAAEERLAELESKVASLAESEARALQAEAALAEAASKLEVAEQARAASGEGPSGADLQDRVAELESAHRGDIAELQRAHESLANTQVELTNVNRKLKEAEARIRELAGEAAPEPERPAAPVPDYVTRDAAPPAREPAYASAADGGSEAPAEMSSFDARLSSLRREIAAATQPEPEPAQPAEEAQAPQEEEGLSLRERLARAAAARHRGPLT